MRTNVVYTCNAEVFMHNEFVDCAPIIPREKDIVTARQGDSHEPPVFLKVHGVIIDSATGNNTLVIVMCSLIGKEALGFDPDNALQGVYRRVHNRVIEHLKGE